MLEKWKTNYVHACKESKPFFKKNYYSFALVRLQACTSAMWLGSASIWSWNGSLRWFCFAKFCCSGRGYYCFWIEPNFRALPPGTNKISLSFDMLVAHPKCLVWLITLLTRISKDTCSVDYKISIYIAMEFLPHICNWYLWYSKLPSTLVRFRCQIDR